MATFEFEIGEKVQNILRGKIHGNERFRFRGRIVARFLSLSSGEPHYVVESERGSHRIYSYFIEKDPTP